VSETKSLWLTVLNSSSVTALVTTLVGGVIVASVTSRYQDKEKERDRARAETADYLERERKVVEDAFNATGRVIAASEDMIQTTSSAFDERHRSSSELTTIRNKKQEIVNHYNDADGNWHTQRTTLTLRLRMEHGANPDVSSAWDKTSSAVTDFSDCARTWFEQHTDTVDNDKLKEACASRKRALEENLDSLTREILKSRQVSMTAKHDPDRLRRAVARDTLRHRLNGEKKP
jgi:hypothetical protein